MLVNWIILPRQMVNDDKSLSFFSLHWQKLACNIYITCVQHSQTGTGEGVQKDIDSFVFFQFSMSVFSCSPQVARWFPFSITLTH